MSLCGNFENNIAVLVQGGGNFHFAVHGRSHIKGPGVAKIEPGACFLQKEETLGPISLLLSQMSNVNFGPNTGARRT